MLDCHVPDGGGLGRIGMGVDPFLEHPEDLDILSTKEPVHYPNDAPVWRTSVEPRAYKCSRFLKRVHIPQWAKEKRPTRMASVRREPIPGENNQLCGRNPVPSDGLEEITRKPRDLWEGAVTEDPIRPSREEIDVPIAIPET